MALISAEESGLELLQALLKKKEDLLKQICEEQSNDAGIFVMDLYTERAALLLHYGKVSLRDAEKWIALFRFHTERGWQLASNTGRTAV